MRSVLFADGIDLFATEIVGDMIAARRMAGNGDVLLSAVVPRRESRSKPSSGMPRRRLFERFHTRLLILLRMRWLLLLRLLRLALLRLFQFGKRRQAAARQRPHKSQLRIIMRRLAPGFGGSSSHARHVDLRLTR